MPFDWSNPYPTTRTPVFARNVVSTSHPLAAQAGVRMLQAGGNALDAILATAAMLTVVEPNYNGLGGDAFAILWDGKELHGLNSSGPAPRAWTPDYFRKRYGEDGSGFAKIPDRGWDTVTVPGGVGAWGALHERFGTLPLSVLFAPAIEAAERGVAVPPVIAAKWQNDAPLLKDYPGWAETFMPKGRAPEVGERFVFPAAGRVLRALVEKGIREFYEGGVAQAIAAWAKKTGGSMTAEDLAGFKPEWVKPASMEYHGYELHEIPPNGQGIAALMALGILKHFDLPSLGPDSPESQHLQIEAMKLAFADIRSHVGDPRAMRVSEGQLLDPDYLARRAALINPRKASMPVRGSFPSGGTVYLTAADEKGMMVSFIQSNYKGFGSGIVVPEYGISLQNRGTGFSTNPDSPNVVAPGKRPYHTIIPGFLTQGGKPRMSFGVMGGDVQPQGHIQTVIRMVDYNQQPQTACDAPRFKINTDFSVNLEARADPALKGALEAMGHKVKIDPVYYGESGAGQFIWRLSDDLEDGYVAASDTRRDGAACGF
ncbi:MAG: gamma-glutamyltransferase family protein [Deltaproteobacteria bacterium]|jgi:gamma-glutamyltranspeptidase/glutathione hydrolase|nr:gamma-glutamyltransferase family protein [Deltaproteobacteria bacterium]